MSTTSQKRALPPTPTTSTKYTNVNDAIQSLLDTSDNNDESLTDRERRWYNDLSNCQKTLEQKDSTIHNLKTIVMEWKKKAIEYEHAYKEKLQTLEDREQFLIKQHKAEIQALTKVQADQTNENLDIIMQLEKENQYLRQKLLLSQESNNEQILQSSSCQIESNHPQQQQLPNLYYGSTTSLLCNNAEIANKQANDLVSSSKDNADELIQRINEMVNVMEGTLHDLQNNHVTLYTQQNHHQELEEGTPTLISDSSSSCSSSDDEQAVVQLIVQQQLPVKKKRSSTIPNFLFRNINSKKDHNVIEIKRNQSLNEPPLSQRRVAAGAIPRKPVRAASILSSSSY